MQYDFTRDTFHPDNNYSRVLMRQGSVLLDADWNEQHAILLHYMRTLAMDMFGRHAAPVSDPGFEIIATFTKVDPDWQKKLNARAAANPPRYAALSAMGPLDNALIIGPGRYYVDGILVINEAPVLYRLPHGQLIDDVNFETVAADSNQSFLIYLDVWERLVTSIQDDGIREKALGGPETCARAQVCWRLRTLKNPDAVDIDTFEGFGNGTLRAQARQAAASAAPCVTAPDARYRGLENHLYRVEIHQGGVADGAPTGAPAPPLTAPVQATFKWSRDNGAAVFPIRSFDGKTAELETLGRDRRFGLKSGDWVEYVDDNLDLRGQPGPLFEVDKACNDTLTVTLTPDSGSAAVLSSVLPMDVGKHPMLRLWNHAEGAKFSGALPVTVAPNPNDGWIDLEDGIQIQFAPGLFYQAGDYWLVPARVATGDVEWPREPVAATATQPASSQPAARRPHGPRHHYAPLLQITADGHQVTIKDRRCRIATLPCL